MKLRSCRIDNFGKLSDLHLEFQDGVNLFHEPNAWGKSTLAAFLRVMFTGLTLRENPDCLIKNVWYSARGRGERMEANWIFPIREKSTGSAVHLEKQKKQMFFIYTIFPPIWNVMIFLPRSEVKFFGLDSAFVLKGAHLLTQNDCECCSTDAINAKLGNLVENTNDNQ